MDNTTYELLKPEVLTAAKTIAREWADVIEQDDAEQEIWLLLLSRSDELPGQIAELDKPARVSYLTEVGHQIAMRYRDDYELFSGNHVYGTEQVRSLLKSDALIPASDERPDSLTHTQRIDLTTAMERLRSKNASYVDILFHNYVVGKPVHSHSQELTRAVDALTREMNNTFRRRYAEYVEGPGSRKVISNEQSQKLTRNDYSGAGRVGR